MADKPLIAYLYWHNFWYRVGVVAQGDLRIAPYLRLAIEFLVYLRLAGFRGVGPLA